MLHSAVPCPVSVDQEAPPQKQASKRANSSKAKQASKQAGRQAGSNTPVDPAGVSLLVTAAASALKPRPKQSITLPVMAAAH